MKISNFELFPIRVPYLHDERSSRVHRGGVTAIAIRLSTDDGQVGWGEACVGADAASILAAAESARPFLIGRSPWQTEAIARDFFGTGLWDHRAMTGNFAFAGIDMALWDLCGKSCGEPIYRMLGGALRDEVDYFCYLSQGSVEHLRRECQEGVKRGHTCFYLKVGIDAEAETEMLSTVRAAIGPDRKLRIDANQAWTVPVAARLLNQWHQAFSIDFVEAPVPVFPLANMRDLRQRVGVSFCANEGLWTTADAYRVIRSRCADILCFSGYWVGTLRRFHTLCQVAHLEGLAVCKHTHGELGIAAAAAQHVLLAIPNACDGAQQTAAMMADDILQTPLPIASTARWGRIDGPGLGIEVSEEKIATYAELYRQQGQFLPYQSDPPQ